MWSGQTSTNFSELVSPVYCTNMHPPVCVRVCGPVIFRPQHGRYACKMGPTLTPSVAHIQCTHSLIVVTHPRAGPLGSDVTFDRLGCEHGNRCVSLRWKQAHAWPVRSWLTREHRCYEFSKVWRYCSMHSVVKDGLGIFRLFIAAGCSTVEARYSAKCHVRSHGVTAKARTERRNWTKLKWFSFWRTD